MYAIHDYDPEKKKLGAFEVTEPERYNKDGFGIFWTPNKFNGDRKTENLEKIRYWFVDIDGGEKKEIYNRLVTAIIKPTYIVETKNGFHGYFEAENATEDNFRIIQKGLIKKFRGDPACKDVSRLLRVPGYFHRKDPNNPFLVKKVFESGKSYKEKLMMYCFPFEEPKIEKMDYSGDKEDLLLEENWDRIFKLNHIRDGNRNNELSRIAFWLRDEGFGQSIVMNTIQRMNSKISKPLEQYEIKQLVRSKF